MTLQFNKRNSVLKTPPKSNEISNVFSFWYYKSKATDGNLYTLAHWLRYVNKKKRKTKSTSQHKVTIFNQLRFNGLNSRTPFQRSFLIITWSNSRAFFATPLQYRHQFKIQNTANTTWRKICLFLRSPGPNQCKRWYHCRFSRVSEKCHYHNATFQQRDTLLLREKWKH